MPEDFPGTARPPRWAWDRMLSDLASRYAAASAETLRLSLHTSNYTPAVPGVERERALLYGTTATPTMTQEDTVPRPNRYGWKPLPATYEDAVAVRDAAQDAFRASPDNDTATALLRACADVLAHEHIAYNRWADDYTGALQPLYARRISPRLSEVIRDFVTRARSTRHSRRWVYCTSTTSYGLGTFDSPECADVVGYRDERYLDAYGGLAPTGRPSVYNSQSWRVLSRTSTAARALGRNESGYCVTCHATIGSTPATRLHGICARCGGVGYSPEGVPDVYTCSRCRETEDALNAYCLSCGEEHSAGIVVGPCDGLPPEDMGELLTHLRAMPAPLAEPVQTVLWDESEVRAEEMQQMELPATTRIGEILDFALGA